MCGIAGLVSLNASPLPPDVLDQMVSALRHRGPDDDGVYRKSGVAFGHRRLSIIDLSSAGHQPMTSDDGAIVLIFNGEIYNYLELEATLKTKGYQYRSRSDTETIIHAYEEWGTDCVSKFNGMFAFALWDHRRRRLFCARDRFGEKPFYYAVRRDTLVFASEIKAILCDPTIPREPNRAVLFRYLRHNLTDTDSSTFFAGIQSLPAAHTLIMESGRITVRRYWRPPVPLLQDLSRSEDDWIAEFRETLRSAVELRMRSDVAVGTCLSGGLDSSSIISLMSGLVGQPVSAFSVVYDEEGFGEAAFVRDVVEAVPIRAYSVTPSGADLIETMQRIVWHNDEPSSSYGQFSQWSVMKLAAEHGVTVILNGQGGDELLGGYHRYLPTYIRELIASGRWKQVWRELGGAAALAGRAVAGTLKLAGYPIVPAALRDIYRTRISRDSHPADFVAPDLAATAGDRGEDREEAYSRLIEHLIRELTVTSLPALLHHEDRCSMAFSREIRLPFLDPRLVELAVRMPSSMKIRNGITKYVLRKAMQHEGLPSSVLNRYDKKGYPTPMGKWLATTARDETRELLRSASFRDRGLVDVGKAQSAFEDHVNGVRDFAPQIWQWMTTEFWFRQFVDPSSRVLGSAA